MEKSKLELPEIFIETHHLLHRYHMIQHSKRLDDFDPRRGQGRILAALKKMSGVNQRELAFILDIRPQSLGELLQKLEQKGYITRKSSDTNKRAITVELTEKGRNIEFQRPDYSELFGCLNESEQNEMKNYLKRIVDKIEELIKSENFNEDEIDHRHHFADDGPPPPPPHHRRIFEERHFQERDHHGEKFDFYSHHKHRN